MTTPNVCPHCASDQTETRVTRPAGGAIKRIRGCLRCGTRWTTYELHAAPIVALRAALAAFEAATEGPHYEQARKE